MAEKLYYLINHCTAPLYGKLYDSTFFFIDYWSFVHFILGLLIIWGALSMRLRYPFRILGLLLLSWEILEIVFIYIAVCVFKPETIPDQLTDIIIGFMGGFAGYCFFVPMEKKVNGQR